MVWTLARLAITVLFAGSTVSGCTPSAPSPAGLVEVEKPPGLEQLDAAVREQFEELWRDLDEAREGAGLGAAWGALGQWFDIYDYADSAARCYRNALLLAPQEPRWPYYLGRLSEAAGELEAAREHYVRAAKLAPEEMAPRLRLGDLALQQQDLATAEALYDEILATDPGHPGALFGRGRLALQRGDPQAAREPLEILAREQPTVGQVHYTLGLVWRQLGDEARAAEQFQQVPEDNIEQLSLDVGDPWDLELRRLDRGARSFSRRAIRAHRRGEPQQAARLFGQAVIADPDGPEHRVNYALVLRELGFLTTAAEQLAEALRHSEEGSEQAARAHLELGRLLAAQGRPAEAIPHLEAALTVDARSVPAHLELGRLLHRQGRLEEALAHYAVVRSFDRPEVSTRFWHAAVLMVLDRRREAMTALGEDLEQLGGERQLQLLLARLLAAAPEEALRDVDRAHQLLTAALASSKPDVLAAETAAMVAAAEGQLGAAVAWQRAAVAALADQRPRSAVHTARRRLVLYERGEPCRHPWEARETPLEVPVVAP